MSRSILLVEDEPMLLMVLEGLLVDEGYRVQIAQNGSQAVETLEAGALFDVLVTDIRLPHVDGWAIARRARDMLPAVPVIYMSGDSAVGHATKGVPGSTMIAKPFPFDHFLQVVAKAAPEAP